MLPFSLLTVCTTLSAMKLATSPTHESFLVFSVRSDKKYAEISLYQIVNILWSWNITFRSTKHAENIWYNKRGVSCLKAFSQHFHIPPLTLYSSPELRWLGGLNLTSQHSAGTYKTRHVETTRQNYNPFNRDANSTQYTPYWNKLFDN
jgi:hypothetical protein